jgi:hypothetical protein
MEKDENAAFLARLAGLAGDALLIDGLLVVATDELPRVYRSEPVTLEWAEQQDPASFSPKA